MKHLTLTVAILMVLSTYSNCANAQAFGLTRYGIGAHPSNAPEPIYNSAFGYYALNANTTGNKNTGLGANTLRFNTTGIFNTASGYAALYKNVTGNENTGYGLYSLFSNTSGSYNAAYGTYSLQGNTAGSANTSVGYRSLSASNSTFNTAIGYYTLALNTSGANNTGNGANTLYSNTTGGQNTATGVYALVQNSTGSGNTANGFTALDRNTTGNNNTAIGNGSDVSIGTLSNATAIGYLAVVDQSNKVRVGNTSVTSIGGQVSWTTFSDGRFKNNINENVPGLAFINSLRPVSYSLNVKGLKEHYSRGKMNEKDTFAREDNAAKAAMDKAQAVAEKISYSGFVAQEVDAAAKKLNFEFSGVDKPETADGLYGLRYDNFVAPLVKAVQELSQQNSEMKKELAALKSLIAGGTKADTKNITLINAAGLDQNTPNPFTNSTTINYQLPIKYGRAKIVLTDNAGKTVKELTVSGNGKGTVQVNTSMLSSGSYNYSLYVDDKLIGTKQMLRLK